MYEWMKDEVLRSFDQSLRLICVHISDKRMVKASDCWPRTESSRNQILASSSLTLKNISSCNHCIIIRTTAFDTAQILRFSHWFLLISVTLIFYSRKMEGIHFENRLRIFSKSEQIIVQHFAETNSSIPGWHLHTLLCRGLIRTRT